MIINLRKSTLEDLVFIEKVEQECFPDFQQSNRRILRHSLTSPSQEVWIAESVTSRGKTKAGAMILHLHKRTLRIYSIAVLPEFKNKGFGLRLAQNACNIAIANGYEKVSLEAFAENKKLIDWYENIGFEVIEFLPDYYGMNLDGVRMNFVVSRPSVKTTTNLVVLDHPQKWKLKFEGVKIISSKEYIAHESYQRIKNIRIFNLCQSYKYQSLGYYVSLLASAREHRAIPSVTTIRDFKNLSVIRSIANDVEELIQNSLVNVKDTKFTLKIYFGQTLDSAFKTLGNKLYLLFETPLLQVNFAKHEKWIITKVQPISIYKVSDLEWEQVQLLASKYFNKKRFQRPRLKHYKYDMAILVNPDEKNPPSCPRALQKFKRAANDYGFYVDFITKDDYENLSEYDALFIRETTNVNDHTYQFSRKAYAEGLVVIDDPWSILRCSNKIFLNERMQQNNIKTPKSWMLTKDLFKKEQMFFYNFPLILKQPDSAFSIGVTKVTTPDEMLVALKQLFKISDIVIVQEFLPSEYDWRIGVLDNTPLFACKYYMAKNHWQIYNWAEDSEESVGDSETIAIEAVPEKVLKVAVKAASLMGDGLYGVDLKEVNGEVYLIEVNDNPNVDADIEDLVLGDQLYGKIMESLYNRIETSRNMTRNVAIEPN